MATKKRVSRAIAIVKPSDKLITGSGREIDAEEQDALRVMVFDALGKYLDDKRMNLLMEAPPKYAIKEREGGGGTMYKYLKHGYVRLKTTQIFGPDWDQVTLPVFSGEPYRLTPMGDSRTKTGNPTVAVLSQLTIRVRKPQSMELLTTINRTAFGSAEWRDKMEFGRALQAANSNSFRAAAATLGPALGLTLYWDDEAEWAKEDRHKKLMEELNNSTPVTMLDLFARAMNEYGLNGPAVCKLTGLNFDDTMKCDPAIIWPMVEKNGKVSG